MDDKSYIEIDKEWHEGIALEENNGSYALVKARKGHNDVIYRAWAYPQLKGKKPADTAVPWKIKLGDNNEEAISVLRHFAMLIKRGEGK